MFSLTNIEFEGVKGVGHLSLNLPDSRMDVLIGVNGVGKTKALESLYSLLLFTNRTFSNPEAWGDSSAFLLTKNAVCTRCLWDNQELFHLTGNGSLLKYINQMPSKSHDLPVVFLAAQHRGQIQAVEQGSSIAPLGSFSQRRAEYFHTILEGMQNNFAALNMETSVQEWFIQRAQSSNRFQVNEDNREIEIIAVLRILNQIDERISAAPENLKISGSNSVSILLDGQEKALNELSSGFSSLIKIVQSIVAGYSFFTNSRDLEQVKGYVLIDEIESHLHLEWQTKILPILSRIFPNTRFIITTHSSLVLARLTDGSAYRLVRESDRVITKPIDNPNNTALIDLLYEAFNVDLNQIRIDSTSSSSQKAAKDALLSVLGV